MIRIAPDVVVTEAAIGRWVRAIPGGGDADDLRQEVVVAILEALPSMRLEGTGAEKYGYVRTVALNRLRDLAKRSKVLGRRNQLSLDACYAEGIPDTASEVGPGVLSWFTPCARGRHRDSNSRGRRGHGLVGVAGAQEVALTLAESWAQLRLQVSDRVYRIARLRVEGYSFQEIAEKFGESNPNAVQVAFSRVFGNRSVA